MPKIIFYFYTLLVFPIHFLFFIFSFLHPRAKNFRKQRIENAKEISLLKKDNEWIKNLRKRKVYWFHGASVGELDQAKSMGRELKKNEPNSFLILSWTSDSVTPKNLQDSIADFHIPLPLDGPFSFGIFFSLFQPEKLLIFSWDTWAWFIQTAVKFNASVYLVCGTLSDSSGRMGFFSKQLTQYSFSKMSGILTAHAVHEKRFQSLIASISHPPFLSTEGDTRFDSVVEKMRLRIPPPSFPPFWENWQKQFPISSRDKSSMPMIFASTYDSCEKGIIPFLSNFPRSRAWIFPHKVDKQRIKSLQEKLLSHQIPSGLYSEGKPEYPVVIFDELGILAFAYKWGRFAYVGGAFHHRVHNVIEPAFWALPIITGEKIGNSSEALVLKEMGGLFTVSQPADLTNILSQWQETDTPLLLIGEKNKNFVLENVGASSRIYKRIWE